MAAPADAGIWNELTAPAPPPRGGWLRWHPSQIDECVKARASALPSPLASAELDEIAEFNRRCGADESSLAALAKLGSPNARVVIAAQQPGPLAGPLYTLYKAMGAVLLARGLAARRPGLDFVPVFWVGSEDHDFHEVRRVYWPGNAGELEEMLLECPEWRPGRMIGTLKCGEFAAPLIERVRSTTFETEFKKPLLDILEDAYAKGRTFEEAFCRLLFALLPGRGLVVVSPLMKWIRRRGAAVLKREAEARGATSGLMIRRASELEAAGLAPQVHRRAGAINFFWVDPEERRHALTLEGETVRAFIAAEGGAESAEPRAGAPRNLAELIARIDEAPDQFSFNVVTRPVVQDSILPTVAQLVGPGEAAYFAQVDSAYASFGAFAPVRWPRPMATLVDNASARLLKKNGLELEEAIESNADALERRVIERSLGEGPLGEIRALEARQRAEIEALRARLGGDSSVQGGVEKLLQSMEKGYATVVDRLLYSQKQGQQHVGQAMRKLANALRPAGQPQERALNPLVPFAVNYGLDWPEKLEKELAAGADRGPRTFHFTAPKD